MSEDNLTKKFEDDWRERLARFCFDHIFEKYGKDGPRNRKAREAALLLTEKIYRDFNPLG